MLWEMSISISTQKARNGPGWSRKLWSKNAQADTLGYGLFFWFGGAEWDIMEYFGWTEVRDS